MQNLKKYGGSLFPLGDPGGSQVSSPLLGFCAGLHLAAALHAMQRTWESFSSAQGCPSMVSAWRKTCYWFLKSGRPRERGCGVWDEGEQSDNVPHFCWKYIDASEHSGSPWDAWLLGPVTCMRAMGLSRSMMLSASSPWLLAAL